MKQTRSLPTAGDMPSIPCATPRCPGNASGKCEKPEGEKLCGNCCNCPGHGRRSFRGGRTFGRKSAGVQADRGRLFAAFDILQEAVNFLVEWTVGELPNLGLHTPTAMRRALYSAVRHYVMPAAPGSIDHGSEALVAALPYLLLQRLIFGCARDLANGVVELTEPPPAPWSPVGTGSMPSIVESSTARGSTPQAVSAEYRVHRDSAASTPASAPYPSASPSPTGVLRARGSVGLVLHVSLSAVDDATADEAVQTALSFKLGPPPSTPPPTELEHRPHGHFLWDIVRNRPAAPVCRSTGPFPVLRLQCSSGSSLQEWESGGGAICFHDRALGATTFSNTVQHWMATRRYLREGVSSWSSLRPPWANHVMQGAWLYGAIQSGTPSSDRLVGYHGTSMHALERMMRQGMETGWDCLTRKNVERKGIYFHDLSRARLCHNYMLYSALDATGFMVAPIICLSAPNADPQGRKTIIHTSGETQNLTYPEVCQIHGIWLHVMHLLQFRTGEASNWIYAETRFAAFLEPDPDEDRGALEARSRLEAESTDSCVSCVRV